jgi:hypothetical protein
MFENELILALQVLEDGDLRMARPISRPSLEASKIQVVSSFRSHRYGGYGSKNWKRNEKNGDPNNVTGHNWSKKKFLVLI